MTRSGFLILLSSERRSFFHSFQPKQHTITKHPSLKNRGIYGRGTFHRDETKRNRFSKIGFTQYTCRSFLYGNSLPLHEKIFNRIPTIQKLFDSVIPYGILAVKTSWLSRETPRRKTPRLYPLVGERWETYAQTE